MKAAYAYVAVAALAVVLAALSVLFTAHDVAANDRKFCEVVTGVTAQPVPRPPNPGANPSREQDYLWYLRFVRLGRALGC